MGKRDLDFNGNDSVGEKCAKLDWLYLHYTSADVEEFINKWIEHGKNVDILLLAHKRKMTEEQKKKIKGERTMEKKVEEIVKQVTDALDGVQLTKAEKAVLTAIKDVCGLFGQKPEKKPESPNHNDLKTQIPFDPFYTIIAIDKSGQYVFYDCVYSKLERANKIADEAASKDNSGKTYFVLQVINSRVNKPTLDRVFFE